MTDDDVIHASEQDAYRRFHRWLVSRLEALIEDEQLAGESVASEVRVVLTDWRTANVRQKEANERERQIEFAQAQIEARLDAAAQQFGNSVTGLSGVLASIQSLLGALGAVECAFKAQGKPDPDSHRDEWVLYVAGPSGHAHIMLNDEPTPEAMEAIVRAVLRRR